MRKWVGKAFLLLNLMAAWALVAYIVSRGFQPDNAFTPTDLISIVLSALGVTLAVLTIFLAILAFWGYNSFKDVAKEVATKVARQTAEEVAGRQARSIQDQESGQGDGDEYASAATDKSPDHR